VTCKLFTTALSVKESVLFVFATMFAFPEPKESAGPEPSALANALMMNVSAPTGNGELIMHVRPDAFVVQPAKFASEVIVGGPPLEAMLSDSVADETLCGERCDELCDALCVELCAVTEGIVMLICAVATELVDIGVCGAERVLDDEGAEAPPPPQAASESIRLIATSEREIVLL
jgi:hypothetical protein